MYKNTSVFLSTLLLTVGLMAEKREDVLDQSSAAADITVAVDASTLDKKQSSSKEKTAEEIAAELRNPATPTAALATKWEYRTYDGDLSGASDQTSTNLLFQPSFPIPLGDGKVFAFRPALPIFFDTPYFDAGTGQFDSSTTSIGDIGFDIMMGKTWEGGLVTLGGVVGTLPTASNENVGGEQYKLGGEALIAYLQPWGAVGGLISHQWDIGGSNDIPYSTTSINYIYAFSLGGGWQISSGPIITYDWEAESGNRWSVPIGVGIFKTVKTSGMPWKLGLQVQKYVVKKDAFTADWFFQLVITPVVNNPFAGMFK